MPIERKILLSVLVSLIIVFASYFLYSEYYVTYKNNLQMIAKYEKLISKASKKETDITDDNVATLNNREVILESYFAPEENLKELTTHIKKLLLDSGLSVSQYSIGEKSSRFSFTGTKESFRSYLLKIRKEPLYNYYPMFTIRMIDNNNVSGQIEVSQNIKTDKPNKSFLKESLRTLKREEGYSGTLISMLGANFDTEPEVILIAEVTTPVKEVTKTQKTDKFYFVGTLKRNNETITIFKEKNNGRIYQFKTGETISDWKYLGFENNAYLFEKDEVKYEVRS